MRFLSFAVKNLGRNKRRTAANLSLIAFGAVALVLAGGYAAATFRGLRESTIANGLGHLQIGAVGFRDDEERPLARGLADLEAVRRTVLRDGRVRAAAARVEFVGLISSGERSLPFLGRGVEPEVEYGAAGFPRNLSSGHAVAPADRHQVALGVGLARALRAKPGDSLTLLASTVDGALNGVDVEVVGLVTTGVREMDERALVVRLDTAQAVLATDRVSKLVVRLRQTADTPAARADLARALAAEGSVVEVVPWTDLATFYHQVRGLYGGIFLFMGLIVVGLVVLSCGHAMAMTIVERTREIGTFLALGTSRLRVLAMFVTEGLSLGVLGAGLGVGAGSALAALLTRAGIQLPPPPTYTRGFPLVIDVVPGLGVGIFAILAATMVVASLLPAGRAARLRITEALVHV